MPCGPVAPFDPNIPAFNCVHITPESSVMAVYNSPSIVLNHLSPFIGAEGAVIPSVKLEAVPPPPLEEIVIIFPTGVSVILEPALIPTAPVNPLKLLTMFRANIFPVKVTPDAASMVMFPEPEEVISVTSFILFTLMVLFTVNCPVILV